MVLGEHAGAAPRERDKSGTEKRMMEHSLDIGEKSAAPRKWVPLWPSYSQCGSPRLIFARILDAILFLCLLTIISAKALSDLDIGWDNLSYHLPFAALRSGIFGPEFDLGPYWTAVYEGFPPLHDLLKGYLWKLSGDINSTNLLTVVVFALYVVILHFLTGAPLIVIACAIAAIPVIHVQIGSGHADNLSNLAFSLALVATFIGATQVRRDAPSLYYLAVLALVFAANVKLQFVLLSSLALVLITFLFWAKYARFQDRRIKIYYFGALALGCVAILWLPFRSIILFGNPLYPVHLDIFGYILPGTLHTSDFRNPIYLKHYPQFLKWVVSVSEYHAYDLSPVPYSIGQGHAPTSAMSFRMGGYLFVYVCINLMLFLILVIRRHKPFGILASAIALTGLVAILPASQELRYFSFWMITLVSCVIYMLWANQQLGQMRLIYAIVCFGCFWFVASITGYAYLKPQGFSMDWVSRQIRFEEKFLPLIQPGHSYCLVNFGPYAIVAAPAFHPKLRPYKIYVNDNQANCTTTFALQKVPALWLEYQSTGLSGLNW